VLIGEYEDTLDEVEGLIDEAKRNLNRNIKNTENGKK